MLWRQRRVSLNGSSDQQRLFTLLPIAGAKLIGLQRIEHAQHFLRIAAHRKIRHIHEADDAFRIDDEGSTLCHAGLWIEDAKLLREIALYVSQHGEGQVLQVFVIIAPRKVNELGVDAAAKNLRIAILELIVDL